MAILAECPQCHKKQSVRNKACACGKDLDKAKRANRKLHFQGKDYTCGVVRYWIDFIVPGTGKAKREPVAGADDPKAYSIEEARAAEGKRKAQKVEAPRVLQRAPEEKMTFKELANWYLGQEKVKALRYFPTLSINLASFNQELGDTIVGQIKSVDLENYQAKRKREGYSDAYIDRHIEAARAMVNKAFDNDMVTGETVKVFRRVKKMLKRNSNARDRILTLDEFKALMNKLPRHTKAILATGFYTGMRRREVLSLTWDKVDMEKRMIRLEAEDTKDKEPRVIPILPELYEIVKATPRAIHVECPKCHTKQPAQNKKCACGEELHAYVFLYRGKPVDSIKTGLIKACKDAEITYGRFQQGGFVFHDLRHSFNTYMRKAGVAQSVIMKITGHSTDEMFRRYNSIDAADAHQAIDQYGSFLRNLDQTLDQEGKTK